MADDSLPVDLVVVNGTDTLEPVSPMEELATILPYFPDDDRKAKYLSYVASGWTRNAALIRCKASSLDRDEWRNDERFKQLDDLGYSELRIQVADAYAERLVRRNVVEWLEFDYELLQTARAKYETGIALTTDERAIILKRASNYSSEALSGINKLMNGKDLKQEGEELANGVIDVVGFVMRRQNIK